MIDRRSADLTLVINAGGDSRRMGQPKALLPVPPHGVPLIAHIVGRLAALQPRHIVVVSNDPALPIHAQLPQTTHFVVDAYPDAGALGGIATGLQHAHGWAVVVACDLPLVNATLFGQLCENAAEQDNGTDCWDAIVPVVGGYEEPLHALYHRRCLPAVEAQLAQGQRRVISFMPAVRTLYIKEEDLRVSDPDLLSFFNTNTPQEWQEALQLLARAGG